MSILYLLFDYYRFFLFLSKRNVMLNGVGDETTMNLAKVILFHIIEGG